MTERWQDEPGSRPFEPEPTITCIDCGGICHLLTRTTDEDGRVVFEPGDLVTYRCEDCLDRWDLLVPEEDA